MLYKFKALVNELSTFRPMLTITGLEPFMRKNALETLEYIHEKKTHSREYYDLNFIPGRKRFEPFLVSRIDVEDNAKFCPLIDYSYGNVKEILFSVLRNNRSAIKKHLLLKR